MAKLITLKKSWIFTALALLFALGLPLVARADCPTTMGYPQVIDYGSVGVPNTLPSGAVIPGTVRSFRIVGTCASSSSFGKDLVLCPSVGLVAGMSDVYPTGHAGVGMRMRDQNGAPLVGTGQCASTSSLGKVGSTGKFDVGASLELVKTGAIAPGPIGAATYYGGILNTGIALNDNVGNISVLSTVPFRDVTCSVAVGSANQTVALPTVTVHSLANAGQTAGITPFQIKMTCAAGVRVNMTLESASGDSGMNSVLASTGASSGVGIQVLDATHKAIVLNEIRQLIDSTTGDTTIAFFAQYYRLASALKPGPVTAAAIYTMSYQ